LFSNASRVAVVPGAALVVKVRAWGFRLSMNT
jgi:hypothetical protein